MGKKLQWGLVVLLVLLVTIVPPIMDKIGESISLSNTNVIITNDSKEMNESTSGLMLPGIENRQVSDALIGIIGIAVLVSTTFHFDRLAKRNRERMRRLQKQYEEKSQV